MMCNIFYISNEHLNVTWKKYIRSLVKTQTVAREDFPSGVSTVADPGFHRLEGGTSP